MTVFMMLGSFVANAQNPYEMFGYESNVEYTTRISDLFSVVNTDTTSLIRKMVFKFDENKIISYDKNDNIIAIENIAPNQILRFLSIDAHAESYPSTSPYAYCLNNPMNAIDPDGKDVIVLNNPNGAEGFGHMAVLVGNDKDGWTYISKEGRDKNPWYSNQLTGGPALTKISH